MARFSIAASLVGAALGWDQATSLPLYNAAVKGLTFPMVGLGTGGYGFNSSKKQPECWAETAGCGATAEEAIAVWLANGGERIDDANSYFHQNYTGYALAKSPRARSSYFYLSKVGPSYSLGYQDILDQVEGIKTQVNISYVDALLIHWPEAGQQGSIAPAPSKDPLCQLNATTYNEKECRISSWRAMVKVFNSGFARSIGVSNYNSTHIQDIIDAGLPLPAINQRPFNPHRAASSKDIIEFCKQHNILFNGYSPLGVPDMAAAGGSRGAHVYPSTVGAPTLLEEKVIGDIAKSHQISPAQVLLAWSFAKGVPSNPRSVNEQHMKENMAAVSITLSNAEIQQIDGLNEDWCDLDPLWYECAARNNTCPPQCCDKPPCTNMDSGVCCGAGDQ
eukprot:TRINITY_DN676_c0_g1_i1.p1 TRINITY_DN676_c0_g1~~TRINITY_DN676_c0_g1_i1.p1  ORF type:complete len:415 (+),score=84.27 TRINITY_DN676_c0_g1_i1:73-1245(+)